MFPGEILFHAVVLYLFPNLLVLKGVNCHPDGVKQIRRVVSGVGKTVPFFLLKIIAFYRVCQAPCFPYNRHCAVFQGYQLAQAARFEIRGHQEHVGTCVYHMRQGVVKFYGG